MTSTANRTSPRPTASVQTGNLLALDPPSYSALDTIVLSGGKFLMGASAECDIHLQAEGVHDRHAMILVGDRRTVVKALDPRTWLNDGPLTETALRPGDRLSIGPLTFRVRRATTDELAAFVAISEPEPHHRFSPMSGSADVGSSIETVVESSLMPSETTSARTRQHIPTRPSEPNQETPLLSRLDEIQKSLSELNRSSVAVGVTETTVAAGKSAESISSVETHLQPNLRLNELQRRSDEIARQAQLLDERTARVVDRETSVQHQRQQLNLETQRLAAVADTARRNLSEEHARQLSQWQEWDAAYHRMSAELATQFELIERQRTVVQVEADRLVANRVELDRQRAECDRAQRECVADRARVDQESSELQQQKAKFDEDQQQWWATINERESQLATERHDLVRGRDELLATRQEIERDRTSLMTERSAQALRIEQEWRDQSNLRAPLDEERSRLQVEHQGLLALREELELERANQNSTESRAVGLERELAEKTARLEQAEKELIQRTQSQEVLRSVDVARSQQEQQERSELLAQIEDERRRMCVDRDAIQSLRSELDAEWKLLARERSKFEAALVEQRQIVTQPAPFVAVANECAAEYEPPPLTPVDLADDDVTHSDAEQPLTFLPAQEPAVELPSVATGWNGAPDWTAPSADEKLATSDYQTLPEPVHFSASTADDLRQFVDTDSGQFASTVPRGDSPDWMSVWSRPYPPVVAASAAGDDAWEHAAAHVELDDAAVSATTREVTEPVSVGSDLWSIPSSATDRFVRNDASMTRVDVSPFSSLDSSISSQETALEVVAPIGSWDDRVRAQELSADTELESAQGVAVAEAELDARVTLEEVNREFGAPAHVDLEAAASAEGSALPSWWTSMPSNTPSCEEQFGDAAAPSTMVDLPLFKTTLPAEPSGLPHEPPRSADVTADDLRSKLASLFDLDLSAEPAVGERVAYETASAFESSAAEGTGVEESSAERDRYRDQATGSMLADSIAERLRGSAIEASSEKSPAETISAAADHEATEEDSVDAFMARLLARSRGDSEAPAVALSTAPDRQAPPAAARTTDSKPESQVIPPLPITDRSHLTAEPKHKQDREVVRENLQSFREVAHLSARAALARHSSIQLRNAVIAKGVLFGGSALAAVSFFSAPLIGHQPQIMNGVACSLAALLAAVEFSRSRKQLRQPLHGASRDQRPNVPASAADETSATEAGAIPENAHVESSDQTPAE